MHAIEITTNDTSAKKLIVALAKKLGASVRAREEKSLFEEIVLALEDVKSGRTMDVYELIDDIRSQSIC